MRKITKWKNEDDYMNTEYGRISYKEWCEKEIKRIDKNRCSIQSNKLGQIAIFREGKARNKAKQGEK